VLDPFNPVANLMGAADFLNYLRNRLANNLNLQGLPTLLARIRIPNRSVRPEVWRILERSASAINSSATLSAVRCSIFQ
jgi:hypothetical protein